LKNFDPSSFDLDIYAQNVTGLGRGRGFQVISKSSVLHSEVTRIIKQRLLDLLLLLYKNDRLSKSELQGKFGLVDAEELEATSALLEESRMKVKRLKEVLGAIHADREEIMSAVKALIELFEEKLGSDWFMVEEEDTPLQELRVLVEKLIDEYLASRAGQEELEIN